MTENWPLFVFVAGLVAAWSLIIWGLTKSLIDKNAITVDKRIDIVGEVTKDSQRIERELLILKADLPLNYVRKEDFIRHEVVINTKLDRLRDLIESMMKEKKDGN
jgi:hypothetical protein